MTLGLRPKSRCPALGAGVTAEAVASGERTKEKGETGGRNERQTSVAPRTLPRTHCWRGSRRRGAYPFGKRFLENLAPQWVDGSFIGCYGYRASDVKAKSVSTLALFSKTMKFSVTPFCRHCSGRTYSFTVEGNVRTS